MKKILLASLALAGALSAQAAALTVTHTETGNFDAELTAAMAAAGLTDDSQVTELTVISAEVTDDEGNVSYVEFNAADCTPIRARLRPSLVKIDFSQTSFTGNHTPGGQWDNSSFLTQMTKLQEAVLPEGLTGIMGAAFKDCTVLKTVNIPSTVRILGSYAFQGCTVLAISELPEDLTTIGASAFLNATNVTFSTLPEHVVRIEADAFNGASKVSFPELPAGIHYLGNKAFRNTAVSFSSIPNNFDLTKAHTEDGYFGTAVFVNCSKMTEIEVPEFLYGSIPNQTYYVGDINAKETRTVICRAPSAPTAAISKNKDDYTGVFGQAPTFPNYTLKVLKDASASFKANAPYNSMQVTELTTTMTLGSVGEGDGIASISHEHHGELDLTADSHEIYEGTHNWTFTPADGYYITSIDFAPAAARVAAYSDVDEGDIEDPFGDEDPATDANNLYTADSSVDSSELNAKAVTIPVTVDTTPRALSVSYAKANQIETGIGTIDTEAVFSRCGNIITVAAGEGIVYDLSGKAVLRGATLDLSTLGRGVYVFRAGSSSVKIAL